jgi:uncharacterized protein YuzE
MLLRLAIQTVKLNYHPDTDSLYIDLSEETSVESREISDGVVLDYDAKGNLVGIDIDNASTKVDLQKLIVSKLPGPVETSAD